MTNAQLDAIVAGGVENWLGVLGAIAIAGLIVAAIESRTMASAILGGQLVGRPLTVRGALARSRMSFWRVVVGSFIVAIPVAAAQLALGAVFEAALGRQTDVSIVSTTLAAALAGAPFAYVLSGIVLGDVDPFEAARRSFRVFRARKVAAAVVAVFETAATMLVLVGLLAGLDIAVRIFSALGLGPESGPVGLTLMTLGILAGVFALGYSHLHGLCDRGGPADRDVRRPDTGDVRSRSRPVRWGSRPIGHPPRATPIPLADDPDADRVRERPGRPRGPRGDPLRLTVSRCRARAGARRRCRGGGRARG